MKIKTKRQPLTQGSVLIVTLMTATIIGSILASYLALVCNQNLSVARSQAWNSAVAVMEAGVEEALTQIHYNGYTKLLSRNDWKLGDDGLYHKTRHIGDDGNYYDVGIQPINPPVIFSIGYVPAPSTAGSQLGMILGQIVSGPASQSTPRYISRRVRVSTKGRSSFNYAMLAKGNINFSGSARTDSFDSTDPTLSTNGKYDPAKARDKGDVASNGTVTKTFIGSMSVNLYGHLATGPGGGYSLSSDASVGDMAWHGTGSTGVEPGWFRDDMNIEIPDVQAPFDFGSGLTPMSGTVDGNRYAYVLGDGNWNLSKFVLSSSQKAIVTGKAVLYVTDTLAMSGTSQIVIAPGASLQIYNAAASGAISGSGVLNETGNAANFIYYGLPTNTKLTMSGTSGFIGVIYAPEADFVLSGGSSSGLIEFTGASVSKTVAMTGGRDFHYDESLARLVPRNFVVTAWNEY